MDNNKPLVSVYITTYNRLVLLKRALNSVLDQTYRNIEIIIVDDGSTDGSREYLSDREQECSFIKIMLNETNVGACAGRNKAIQSAKGEFITGLDDDDYFLPDRIETFLSAWNKKKSNTTALFSNSKTKLSDSEIVDKKRKKLVVKEQLYFDNSIGNQVFTKPEYLKSIGGFDELMPAWQDLDCWIRLLETGVAENVGNFSYVIDISHSHERITSQKLDKINAAFLRLKQKGSLSKKFALRLEAQLVPYNYEQYSISKLLFKSLILFDFLLTAKLLNFFFKRHGLR